MKSESWRNGKKSMPGCLMSLTGGPPVISISWKSSRQQGVTLSSSEAEFVATSQAGHEVVYLSVLLKGFGSAQKKLTQIWENNQACPNLVLLC